MNPDQDQAVGAVVAFADLVRDPLQGSADLVVGKKLGGAQVFLLSGLAGPVLKGAECDGSRRTHPEFFSEIFGHFPVGNLNLSHPLFIMNTCSSGVER